MEKFEWFDFNTDLFYDQVKKRFEDDPGYVFMQEHGQEEMYRVQYTDEKMNLVKGSREDVAPDFEVLHEYSQARQTLDWLDKYLTTPDEEEAPDFPDVEPYSPAVEAGKVSTVHIRDTYTAVMKKLNMTVDPKTEDVYLKRMEPAVAGDQRYQFSGFVAEESYEGKAVHLRFNPFSPEGAPKVLRMHHKKANPKKNREEMYVGSYKMDDKVYQFKYEMNYYRVHADVWMFNLVKNMTLVCFDLVSVDPFYNLKETIHVTHSIMPVGVVRVDSKLCAGSVYDISKRLGRDHVEGDAYMCLGSSAVVCNRPMRVFPMTDSEAFSVKADAEGDYITLYDGEKRTPYFVRYDDIVRQRNAFNMDKTKKGFTRVVLNPPDLPFIKSFYKVRMEDRDILVPCFGQAKYIYDCVDPRIKDKYFKIPFKMKGSRIMFQMLCPLSDSYTNGSSYYVLDGVTGPRYISLYADRARTDVLKDIIHRFSRRRGTDVPFDWGDHEYVEDYEV